MTQRRVLVSDELPELRSGNEPIDQWARQYLRLWIKQAFSQFQWAATELYERTIRTGIVDELYAGMATHSPIDKTNGNISASFTFDSGHEATEFTADTGDQAAYIDDFITFAVGTDTGDGDDHAVYLQVDLVERVTRVRAEVMWPATSNGGSAVAIVVPSAAWVENDLSAPAGIHAVFFGNGQWHVGYWDGATEDTYADDSTDGYGRYAAVTDGEVHEIELWIDTEAGTCRIYFPDGTSAEVTDARIASDTANYAIYELFVSSSVPDTDAAQLRRLVADSLIVPYGANVITRPDVTESAPSSTFPRYEIIGQGSISESIPAGVTTAIVTLISPGGGGASGERRAAGVVRKGGSSGGSGGVIRNFRVPRSALGATFILSVGAAGVGGAAVTTDDTGSTAGTAGSSAEFFSDLSGSTPDMHLKAFGGGGATATILGGAGAPNGTTGITADAAGGVSASVTTRTDDGAGQAPAGGGITAGDSPSAGADGGVSLMWHADATGGTGGVVGGATPTSGAVAQDAVPGEGPGSGAASITTAAQAGADGVGYGSPGAGGGASLNGNASGKGGDGGPGYALLEFV